MTTRARHLPLLPLLTAVLSALVASPAGAADVHWNVSSGNYSNPQNWSPFGVPGPADDVTFGELVPGATGAINIDADVADIFIRNGSNIWIYDPAVTVTADYLRIDEGSSLTVTGFTEAIDVDLTDPGGRLFLLGSLFLTGGWVQVREVSDWVAGTGLIEGDGRFGVANGQFRGTIRPEGGTLTMYLANFDLDGVGRSNTTIIDAVAGGELIVHGGLTDPYSATIDIAPGGRVEFVDADVDTFVQLTGTATERAELSIDRLKPGGSIWASGGLCGFEGYLESGTSLDVHLTADTEARITAEAGSTIEVDGFLRLVNGTTELGGATVFGTGTIQGRAGSSLRIAQPSTITVPIVELGDTIVLGGMSLTVNADQITLGDPAVDGFEDHFSNWGTTTINTSGSWRMGGTFDFDNGLVAAELHGSPMVVTDGGLVRSLDAGGGLITSSFQMQDGASMDLVEGVLRLDGLTSFTGGSVTGDGTLMQNAPLSVDGVVTINPKWFAWDGLTAPTLDVGSAGQLTVDARGLDGRVGTIFNYGSLDVTNRDASGAPIGWATSGLVRAYGGSVFSGTELTLDGGILELVPFNGPVSLNGPLRVENGGQVQMASFGAPLTLNATTTLVGTVGTPTITGDGDLTTTGDIEVYGNAHIDCALFDWDGIGSVSTTTVHSGSSLLVELEHFSAAFGFDRMGGTIVLEPGAGLRVLKDDTEWEMSGVLSLDDATIAQSTRLRNTGDVQGAGVFSLMQVDNAGTFAPSGIMSFENSNYTQTANGALDIDIAGPLPGQGYGRLEAFGLFGGTATLDGTLRVRLENGYVPTIGTVFTVVDADTLVGSFDPVDAPGFSVTYLSDRVLLVFIGLPPCDADVDGDNMVGFGDLLAVLSNWGPCPGCAADVNGDGAVDFDDLLAVLSAWGGCP